MEYGQERQHHKHVVCTTPRWKVEAQEEAGVLIMWKWKHEKQRKMDHQEEETPMMKSP